MFRSAILLVVGVIGLGTAGCQAGASSTPTPTTAASTAEMTIALSGEFHSVDGEATGSAKLVQVADGSYEVVLEDFSIDSTEHLNLVLVETDDVMSTTDVDVDALLDLGPLQGTSGMQVYPIPADMSGGVMTYHTVVIWDDPMGHAIAAAPLSQP